MNRREWFDHDTISILLITVGELENTDLLFLNSSANFENRFNAQRLASQDDALGELKLKI
jgi:hypothetical protein